MSGLKQFTNDQFLGMQRLGFHLIYLAPKWGGPVFVLHLALVSQETSSLHSQQTHQSFSRDAMQAHPPVGHCNGHDPRLKPKGKGVQHVLALGVGGCYVEKLQ